MAKQQRVIDAVSSYGKQLFGFIRSRVRNKEDAEDILQDVWYQLSMLIDTEPVEQLGAWLYRVSRNRIADSRRKLKPELIEADKNDEGETSAETAFRESVENRTPESDLERKFLEEAFFAALYALPPKQRDVFIRNELEEMTLQQIADSTGESLKTIISRKRYAVAKLRELLHEIYYEY